MARKSNKSEAPAAPVPTSTVVGTVAPRDGNTYVSKSDAKDALRTAARAAGGKWGLVSIEGKSFMLTREDGATLVAVREVGAKVVLTVPTSAPVKVEPPPAVAPAVEVAVEAAVSEGSTAAPAPEPRKRKPKAKVVAAPVEAPTAPVAVVVEMDEAHAAEVGF